MILQKNTPEALLTKDIDMMIGLSGYGGSGKDTVANYLVENYGYRRKAFADPIKDALIALNPYITPNIRLAELVEEYGWEVAKKGYSEARRLIQVMGTEVGREMFGERFWVDLCMDGLDGRDRVVFSDVRFVSEADDICLIGGSIWRIERSGVGPVNDHMSEIAMDSWDFDVLLRNVDTKQTLFNQVDIFMRQYGIHRVAPSISA